MSVLTDDRRNIIDEFKGLSVETIRQKLDTRRRPFATLILNIDYDLNIATIIRTHNAFCGQEIFYLGRRRFNRRGCVGTYHYENLIHFDTLKEAQEQIPSQYTWVGIDNRPDAVPITSFDWPENPLIIFGHERGGLDFLPELPYTCSSILNIPQLGSTRSLNVGVASGIAMYDLCNKKGWLSNLK